jgi:thiamine-phosphate pyrophosphorylase
MAKSKRSCATDNNRIYRIIDANINRLREALRVVEEVMRFVIDNKRKSLAVKNMRHTMESVLNAMTLDMEEIELSRDAGRDVGRRLNTPSEMRKESYRDILMANLHRVEESLRVLEDFLKLFDLQASAAFKALRFQTYILEKELIQEMRKK